MTEFHSKRRQPFISEGYWTEARKHFVEWNSELRANLSRPELGKENISLEGGQLADNCYDLLSLSYTAGVDANDLRRELEVAVEASEVYRNVLAVFEETPNITIWSFQEKAQYQRCMQLIGLCYLLHRRDLLPRIAALQDPGYAGYDTLYEDLLLYSIPDRADVDALYHGDPYRHLTFAMYRETDQESREDLRAYCNAWYPAFKHAPWHDSHLRINGTEGDYFGYWAFEAGAIALLCDIDDSSIDHMVYPKDLVAWARENAALSEPDNQGNTPLRCPADQPCPKAGWWFTPADPASRRQFKTNELMPELPSAYGKTIWQFDARQSDSSAT